MANSYADFLGAKTFDPKNDDWILSPDRTNQNDIHFDPSESFAANLQDQAEQQAQGFTHAGESIDGAKFGLPGYELPLLVSRNPHNGEWEYSTYSPIGDGGEYANGSTIRGIDPSKEDYGKDNWEVMYQQNRAGRSLTSKVMETLAKAVLSYGFGLAAGPIIGAASEAITPAAEAATGTAVSSGATSSGVLGSGVTTGSGLADQAIGGAIKGGISSGGDPKGIISGALGGAANGVGGLISEGTWMPSIAGNAIAQGASAALQGKDPISAASGSVVGNLAGDAVGGGSFGSFVGGVANSLTTQAMNSQTQGNQTGGGTSTNQAGGDSSQSVTPQTSSFSSFVIPEYTYSALPTGRDWTKRGITQ